MTFSTFHGFSYLTTRHPTSTYSAIPPNPPHTPFLLSSIATTLT